MAVIEIPPVEDDCRLTDLQQENRIIRQELAALYNQILENGTATLSNNCETQTDQELAFTVSVVSDKMKELTKELQFQKTFNMEQAKNAKEAERKIHSCEMKILESSLELLQCAPLKGRVEELTNLAEQLQIKIKGTSNEYINLTIELKHHQATIESLNKQLQGKEEEIAAHAASNDELKQSLAGKSSVVNMLLCYKNTCFQITPAQSYTRHTQAVGEECCTVDCRGGTERRVQSETA